MRVFANLFLILFLADGGFSLVDELVSVLTPLMPFSAFRNLLAVVVIVMTVPVYLSLGIDRRLPKRIFIPLIVFVFWTFISTSIFPPLAELRTYGLLLAVVQIVLGILPFHFLRKNDEHRYTLPPSMFVAPFFSLRNTLIFSAANLIVVPFVVLLSGLAVANAYMVEHTAGFMHLAPGGLEMTERVYRRNNSTIRLTAMIHIGNKAYYDELAGSVVAGRIIVLAEGVTDDEKLMQNRIDYGRVAGFLGLTSQENMLFKGRLIAEEELDSSLAGSRSEGNVKPDGPVDILRADVDISNFRPPTILFLDALGKHLRESPSFVKGVLALNSWAEKNITPDMYAIIMDDILHRRNMVLIRHLDKALKLYDTVVIPWGALHMKEIEMEVLKRGFKLQEERKRVSIDLRKMLPGRL